MEGILVSDLKVEVGSLSEKDVNNWNDAVIQSEEGGFFHRYEWLKLLEKGLNLEPYHVIVKKGNNIIGGFPNFIENLRKTPFKRLSSIPMGHGGFFIVTYKEDVLELLISKVKDKKNIISHILQTDNLEYIQYSQQLSNFGYKPSLSHCKFTIEINRSFEEIEKDMSKYKRRDIRKLNKSPLKIEEPEITKNNLELFHSLYESTMIRLQVPSKPASFFRLLDEDMKDMVKLFFAKYNEKIIAGFLHFLDKSNSIVYEFFAGSDEKYFEYKPNDLLRKYSILWSQDNNFQIYDMGGTLADFRDGVFKFKKRWGGKVYPYLIWEKTTSRWQWYSYKIGRNVYRRLVSRKQ